MRVAMMVLVAWVLLVTPPHAEKLVGLKTGKIA
jgi:hypothetical protein